MYSLLCSYNVLKLASTYMLIVFYAGLYLLQVATPSPACRPLDHRFVTKIVIVCCWAYLSILFDVCSQTELKSLKMQKKTVVSCIT